jgi:hypothetical protein
MKTINKVWIGIIVFYTALFAGLAFYDEEPSKEMLEVLNKPLHEVIEPGNAWIVMLGFSSPEGVTPYVSGKEKMRSIELLLNSGKDYKDIIMATAHKENDELQLKGDTSTYYARENGGLLNYVRNHKKEIHQLTYDNRELLNRYYTLLTCPRLAEPLDYGYYAPLPHFAPVRSTLLLKNIILAERAVNGQRISVLKDLKEDMEFWRMITRDSDMLLTTLLSRAFLSIDMSFAAELGANLRLSAEEREILFQALRPFETGETSVKKALMGEFRYMHRGMDMARRSSQSIIDGLLIKQNTTDNQLYENYNHLGRLADMTTRQYADKKNKYAQIRRKDKIGFRFLYNPVGELLILMSRGQMVNYIEKGHEIEGFRRLAVLKILLRTEKIPQSNIEKYLESRKSDLGNPYTGEAMNFDSKQQSLFFNKLSGDSRVEMFL